MSLKVAALAAAATALLSATSAVAGTNGCTFESPFGATFDITPLQNVAALNQGVITTTGGDVPCTETVEQNYTVGFGKEWGGRWGGVGWDGVKGGTGGWGLRERSDGVGWGGMWWGGGRGAP